MRYAWRPCSGTNDKEGNGNWRGALVLTLILCWTCEITHYFNMTLRHCPCSIIDTYDENRRNDIPGINMHVMRRVDNNPPLPPAQRTKWCWYNHTQMLYVAVPRREGASVCSASSHRVRRTSSLFVESKGHPQAHKKKYT